MVLLFLISNVAFDSLRSIIKFHVTYPQSLLFSSPKSVDKYHKEELGAPSSRSLASSCAYDLQFAQRFAQVEAQEGAMAVGRH